MDCSIAAIETAVVDEARRRLRAGDVTVELTTADAPHAFPCRHCLRDAEPGEKLLLFSHSPFVQPGPYREVGPVFAHLEPCARSAGGAVPDQLRRRLLAVRGYDRDQRLIACDVAEGNELESLSGAFLARPEVAYVHVRFARAGCYACRIDRAEAFLAKAPG